ncbi:unnamed protein product [Haemonchus placei]|uniref:Uncharacterized protein n=1 Tax=Haemonchus placei TaxID=6290 RepID=A0A0N4VV45_HAEPC|nr:unnamed protein product [Haemonchus placei]
MPAELRLKKTSTSLTGSKAIGAGLERLKQLLAVRKYRDSIWELFEPPRVNPPTLSELSDVLIFLFGELLSVDNADDEAGEQE